jgi:hypothetical protein
MRVALTAVAAVAALATAGAAWALSPPPLVLTAASGTQRAVQGPYCVDNSHTGECFEPADVVVTRFLRARSHERLTIGLRNGTVLHDDPMCNPDCDGTASLYRLVRGRKHFLRRTTLTESHMFIRAGWMPGRYEIQVELVYFSTADGRRGSTSGSFGARVPAG